MDHNIDKILTIEFKDFKESRDYYYVPKDKKILFGLFTIISKGLYVRSMLGGSEMIAKLPDKYVLINDIVYHKPTVTLYFEDNMSSTIYFDSTKKAKEYITKVKNKSKINWDN